MHKTHKEFCLCAFCASCGYFPLLSPTSLTSRPPVARRRPASSERRSGRGENPCPRTWNTRRSAGATSDSSLPRLHSALVLAQADRRNEIHEGIGIRVRHMRTDRGGIIGRVLLVGVTENRTPASSPDPRTSRWTGTRCSRPLRAAARDSRCRPAAACRGPTASCRAGSCRATSAPDTFRTRRILLALKVAPLVRRRLARRSTRFPRCSRVAKRIDRSVFDVGHAEDSRQFHDKRRTGTVVVDRLRPSRCRPYAPPTMYISSGCVEPTFVQ